MRVIIATNPKEKIENARQLLPSAKILEDENEREMNTELITFKATRPTNSVLEYLRSILLVKNYEGEDKKHLMISSPRSIDFEIMCYDFAIELLNAFTRGKIAFKERDDIMKHSSYLDSVIAQ